MPNYMYILPMFCEYYVYVSSLVSGEANFSMSHTGLTMGGFIQPIVARNLLEQPINIEKGLCQRFLWIAPKPMSVPFDELQCVDKEFSSAISKKYDYYMHNNTHSGYYYLALHQK